MSRANPRFRRTNPSLPVVGAGNGVVLYQIWGKLENQLTMTGFMYAAAVNNPTSTQLTTLLGALSAAMFSKYQACLSSDWTYTQETAKVVHRNDIAGVLTTNHAASTGLRGAGHVGTEVACVLLRTSGVKGQHGRGRISLPGIAQGDVLNSSITQATLITALNALGTQMLATASDGANTWTPCIGQRASTSPKLVIGFSPVLTVVVNTLLGTIRRRKIGRGK